MTELELEPSEKDQGVLITDVTDLDEFGEKIVGKETTEGETKTGKEGEAKTGDEQGVDEDKPFTVGMIEAIVRRESLKAMPPGGVQQMHAAGMSSEGYGGEMQTAGSLGGGGSYQQQVVRETVTSTQYGALGSAQGGGGQGGVNAMRTQTIHTASSSSGGSGSGGFSTITESVEGGDGVRSMRTETVRTGSGVSGVSGSVVDGGFGSGGMGILPGGCMVNQAGEGQQTVVMSSGQNVMGMGAFDGKLSNAMLAFNMHRELFNLVIFDKLLHSKKSLLITLNDYQIYDVLLRLEFTLHYHFENLSQSISCNYVLSEVSKLI